MPHKKLCLQWPAKYLAIGLLIAPTMTYAMDLAERKDSLPLPHGLPSASGAHLFSWYDTPGVSRATDALPGVELPGAAANMSVLPFLGTNVDTSGNGLAGLQLEPLRALRVVAPVTNPGNAISGPTTYDVSSLFGSLPRPKVEEDPAAVAALARQINWTRIASKEPKHLDPWSGTSETKSAENERTRISYTYVGPRSYVDYAYAQQTLEWRRESQPDLHKPSPLFMLPAWAASNLTDGAAGSTESLLQDAWWTATARTAQGFAMDEAQLVTRNLGESSYLGSSARTVVAAVNPFHLLDAGLSRIARAFHANGQADEWLGKADVETIFTHAGHRSLIAPEPEYHTTYYTEETGLAPTGAAVDDSAIIASAESFLAGSDQEIPATLYIVRSSDRGGQQTITQLSDLGTYAVVANGGALVPGARPRLARNLNVGKWVVASQHTPFAAIGSTRNGFDMPDPATLSLLAVAGVLRTRTRKRPA